MFLENTMIELRNCHCLHRHHHDHHQVLLVSKRVQSGVQLEKAIHVSLVSHLAASEENIRETLGE